MRRYLLVFLFTACGSAFAGELSVSVEIPVLSVAEYHRPYIAVWMEHVPSGETTNIALWYDTELKDREGEKWLKDMRQWWRRSGRTLTLPVDGVSGATRAPGTHQISFSSARAPLGDLVAGKYRLFVEAAREVGGRELLQIEFDWPVAQQVTLSVQGEKELGAVSVVVQP